MSIFINCNHRGGRRFSTGFTMTDLLASVAAGAAFIIMLLPSLSTARDEARRGECASNLRQLGSAYHLYQSDFDGFVPLRTYREVERGGIMVPAGVNSVNTLSRGNYFGGSEASLCPGWPPYVAEEARDSHRYGMCWPQGGFKDTTEGFVYSLHKVAGEDREYQLFQMNDVSSQENFILLADSIIRSQQMQFETWTPHSPTDGPHFRHAGLANTLFGDGRVEGASPERFAEAYSRGMIAAGSHNLYLFPDEEADPVRHSGLRRP